MMHRELVKQAIEIVGGQKALGDKIGHTQQGVGYLLHKSKKVSGEVAVAIDEATEGKISKEALRPDLFKGAA